VVLKTTDRLDMTSFPLPAYELAELKSYFLGSIQYSSGCPYQCEFCDIPGLYGRNPRLKSPQQITAELDKLLECGIRGSVYFVDDNFIGNRKAALDLLPHLIEWQKKTGFVLRFSCEATLNIAKRPEILAGMREAFFATIFCGIETPDPVALKAMKKDHNMMVPIMEAIKTLNSFGMEVVSGIILGLDTDKPETGAALLEFIDASQIPLLTINLLQALPNTPLWDRLKRENRLVEDEGRESNVDFHLPYEDVVKTWRACMGSAYQPAKLLERYEYQIRETYSNWPKRPRTPQQKSWSNIKLGLIMLRNIFWKVGILGDYKIEFWKFALRRIARGEIEFLISSILVAHHLINFARDASGGHTNASYYSLKLQEASVPAE
jgi:hopanoid C-2 methylase